MSREVSPDYYRNGHSSNESYGTPDEMEPVWVERELIGQGGFGKVTLWKNALNGDLVVIKEFQAPSMHSFSIDEQRFMDEARMVMKLNHRNVVRAIDIPDLTFSREIADLHLCMELCEGGDLRNVLLRPENFCGIPESQFRTMCSDISDGIMFLHQNEITHRDVKPENILLKEENGKTVYKLSDFGYAKEAESNRLQSMVGTLQYAAPEVLRVNQRPYRRSVDCWSFGILVFECACGRRPFLHDDVWIETLSLVEKKKESDIYIYKTTDGTVEYSQHIPEPHQLSQNLVNDLEGWFHRVLEANPSKRDGKESLKVLKKIVNTKFLNLVDMSAGLPSCFDLCENDPLKKLEHFITTTMLRGTPNMFLLLEDGRQLTKDFPLTEVCKVTSTGTVFVFSEQIVSIQFSSTGEQPIKGIISGDLVRMEPRSQEKKAMRGRAIWSIIKQLNQFNSLVMGLKAASQFAGGIHESQSKCQSSDVGVMSTEIRARCCMLMDSWENDVRMLSHLVAEKEDQLEVIKERWADQRRVLENINKELPSLTESVRQQLDKFHRKYHQTKNLLNQTVEEVDKVTKSWTEDEGLLSRSKKLFSSLRSRPVPDESKEADFKATLDALYSQCKDVTQKLSQRNYFLDLLELLKLVDSLEKSTQNIRSNGKKVLNMYNQHQKDLWLLIKTQGEASSVDGPDLTDAHSHPESVPLAPPPHQRSVSEPWGLKKSPSLHSPRRNHSSDANEFQSIVEDSIKRFDVQTETPVGCEELSLRFESLLSSIDS